MTIREVRGLMSTVVHKTTDPIDERRPRALCGAYLGADSWWDGRVWRWVGDSHSPVITECLRCGDHVDSPSQTCDAVAIWGKERVANARRAAALAVIDSVLDATDEAGEEEGEVPEFLQYLDDVARALLTLVEDPT